jgi:hypothetical protein
MSKIRRNLLMNTADKQEYIQDGLIMYLDCLNIANCSNNYWHSDIGNYTFTGNSQYSERGFYFNGSNTYLRTNMNTGIFHILPNLYNCTIEVVFEILDYSKWGMIFADGDWDDKLLELTCSSDNTTSCWCYLPNRYNDASNNGGRFIVPFTDKGVLSASYSGKHANYKLGYYNKQILEGRYNTTTYSTGTTHRGFCMIIGARLGSSRSQQVPTGTGFFNGYIKAIRYYNRPLTAEEILHNQQIDNIKYNIGI